MIKSNNEPAQKFLQELRELDNDKYKILVKLRSLVYKNLPKAKERMMYGGIMFSLKEDFGGLFVSKNHVSFEFSRGYLLRDPEKLLQGTGKYRRHLKIKSLEDIKDKKIEYFIKQIVNI